MIQEGYMKTHKVGGEMNTWNDQEENETSQEQTGVTHISGQRHTAISDSRHHALALGTSLSANIKYNMLNKIVNTIL